MVGQGKRKNVSRSLYRVGVFGLLALAALSLSCTTGRGCWVTEADAPAESLISRVDPKAGEVLRLAGVYLGGFEKGRIAPVELFDFEKSLPMGVEYCVRVSDECRGVLGKEQQRLGLDGDWSLVVDAVVEFQGRADPVQCPVGWVKVLKLIDVSPRDHFNDGGRPEEPAD